jgi:hypothetical protein
MLPINFKVLDQAHKLLKHFNHGRSLLYNCHWKTLRLLQDDILNWLIWKVINHKSKRDALAYCEYRGRCTGETADHPNHLHNIIKEGIRDTIKREKCVFLSKERIAAWCGARFWKRPLLHPLPRISRARREAWRKNTKCILRHDMHAPICIWPLGSGSRRHAHPLCLCMRRLFSVISQTKLQPDKRMQIASARLAA